MLSDEEETELAKIGRTTGYTVGILNAFSLDNVSVSVPGIGLVSFDNCIEVRWKAVDQAFTKPGDSGAVVFTVKSRKAVGLHFAGVEVQRDGTASPSCYSPVRRRDRFTKTINGKQNAKSLTETNSSDGFP